MAAYKSVSTDLGLSLHPSQGISRFQEGRPGVDLCPSVWGFNVPKKPDQEPPLSALPNLQDFTFTLLSSSTLSKPSSLLILIPVSAIIGDFLPDKKQRVNHQEPSVKRKRQETSDPKPHKTQKHSRLTKTSGVGDDGHWIRKWLSLSDVNSSSRLLLNKKDVMESVLPLMDEERRAACQSMDGLRVKIWDLDTLSEHELSLKQWEPGSFLLTSNWSMEFVRRRNLQKGDCIGLRWDTQNLRFLFQKFNAQS
nr:putative B3 domain-containing protein At1g78640 [Ipomoea batatas]